VSGYKRAGGRGERDLRAAVRAATKLSRRGIHARAAARGCWGAAVRAGTTSCCCRTRPRWTRSGPVRMGAILCPAGSRQRTLAERRARRRRYSARLPARREYSGALFRPPARGAARRPSPPRALVRLGVLYAGVVYAWRAGCAAHAVCACACDACCVRVCACCVCVLHVCV
jgi:hypothetical protein